RHVRRHALDAKLLRTKGSHVKVGIDRWRIERSLQMSFSGERLPAEIRTEIHFRRLRHEVDLRSSCDDIDQAFAGSAHRAGSNREADRIRLARTAARRVHFDRTKIVETQETNNEP